MSSKASEEEIVDALVEYVESGAYPENDNVASATLPASALPGLLDGIQKGQESVKVRKPNNGTTEEF